MALAFLGLDCLSGFASAAAGMPMLNEELMWHKPPGRWADERPVISLTASQCENERSLMHFVIEAGAIINATYYQGKRTVSIIPADIMPVINRAPKNIIRNANRAKKLVRFACKNWAHYSTGFSSFFFCESGLLFFGRHGHFHRKYLHKYIHIQGRRLSDVLKNKRWDEITSFRIPNDGPVHNDVYMNPWSLVGYEQFLATFISSGGRSGGSVSGICAALCFHSSPSSVISSRYGSDHSQEAHDQAGYGDEGLLVREANYDFGGIRRTSLLDEIICLQAIIFAGLKAAVAFVRGFPARYGKPLKPGWIAAGAAGLVAGLLLLKPSITGQIWLPWL